MKLSQYLEETQQSIRSFARKCGLSNFKIQLAMMEEKEIPLKTALIVEKMTNGDVTVEELCSKEFIENLSKMKSPFRKFTK